MTMNQKLKIHLNDIKVNYIIIMKGEKEKWQDAIGLLVTSEGYLIYKKFLFNVQRII